ncbi:hypothetical protein GCM10027093_08800 [Paraburkholderia jirisanensis]
MRDILADTDGYSIYRFQMVAWTIALLMVFLASTYYRLQMPTFSVELLYLLGLSSGTFVANRIPETRPMSPTLPFPGPGSMATPMPGAPSPGFAPPAPIDPSHAGRFPGALDPRHG